MEKHLSILGLKVKDSVTGFTGIATSVSFDLYGCIQCVINPGMNSEGKLGDSLWFDKNRLIILDTTPVMKQPDFQSQNISEAEKGPENKPMYKN